MISKIIHYCWFGGKPLPPLTQKCIASWQKFLPNYEIKRWDESNFDINACAYVQEAYQAKKWAFVSDYARFAILYKYGGLYFDTDVEIIKPLDDILAKGPFMGLQNDLNQQVNPGLGLAAAPGLGFYKDMLDLYENIHFFGTEHKVDINKVKTIVEHTTTMLVKHGLRNVSGIQQVAGIYIYPSEYFNPKDMSTHQIYITPNTYTIHHYDGAWTSKTHKLKKMLNFYFGQNKFYTYLKKLYKRYLKSDSERTK